MQEAVSDLNVEALTSPRTIFVGTYSASCEVQQIKDSFSFGIHFFADSTPHSLEYVLKALQSHVVDTDNNAIIIESVVSMINSTKSCGLFHPSFLD